MLTADKAIDQWGKDTIAKIEKDCYILTSLKQIGFRGVDLSVRNFFKIEDTDFKRIRAGIMYSIKEENNSSGSTTISWTSLCERAIIELGLPSQTISDGVKVLFELNELIAFPKRKLIAVSRDHDNERDIWNYINSSN
jgi:hypothetical protein